MSISSNLINEKYINLLNMVVKLFQISYFIIRNKTLNLISETNNNFNVIKSLIINDIFLSLLSVIFGFYLLLLLLILKRTKISKWALRKIVHFLGGTYIAFISLRYQNISGILLTIGIFVLVFVILIISSKGKIITDYFMLNFRKDEQKYTFLINTTLTLVVLFFSLIQLEEYPVVFTAGVLVISWGDTFGEVIGKTYPVYEFKIFNKKSISGSIAVFLFSSLAFCVSLIYYKIPFTSLIIFKLLIGGIICMLFELFSWLWLDNLLLPPCGNLIMLWILFN